MRFIKRNAMRMMILLIIAAALGCTALPGVDDGFIPHDVKILFINVGRADAALVKIDDKLYMIDTGEKTSCINLFAAMNYFGADTLNGLILTHSHNDHVGGVPALQEYNAIETLYSAAIGEVKANGESPIDKLAKKYEIPQIKLLAGDEIRVTDDVCFEVLAPVVLNNDDDNDNSLVLRLRVNGRTLLFTGDMQFAEEATIISRRSELKADILKVANHGNKDATSSAFAEAVSPQYSIISTDKAIDDDSAHPRVLEALSMSKVLITSEYELGILVTIDANSEIHISAPDPFKLQAQLEITGIDIDSQTVTIKNSGDKLLLDRYMIFSQNGDELFVFDDGAYAEAGAVFTVACTGSAGDHIWRGESKAWSRKKPDMGILYDKYGRELSRMVTAP